ncbi:unnamed protein product, partial [Ectocarpus sp. 4 AP-2014]
HTRRISTAWRSTHSASSCSRRALPIPPWRCGTCGTWASRCTCWRDTAARPETERCWGCNGRRSTRPSWGRAARTDESRCGASAASGRSRARRTRRTARRSCSLSTGATPAESETSGIHVVHI